MRFSWFVVGQLMAPVALQRLNVSHPYDFRVAIYTQWAMIGILLVIFIYIPESPCKFSLRYDEEPWVRCGVRRKPF